MQGPAALEDTSGHPIVIDGLWGLAFRSSGGGSGGDGASPAESDSASGEGERGRLTLFFTAGLNHEADGLLGTLTPPSAPAALRPDHEHGDSRRLRIALQGANPVRLSSQPAVSFRIERPGSSTVTLGIYDASGRLVAQPVRGYLLTDAGEVRWDGRDLRGARVPSGTYFYRATDGAREAGGRLLIVR